MKDDVNVINGPRNRRSFLKTGLAAAGAVGTGFLARGTKAYAQQPGLTAGDVAILQFLAVEKPSKLTSTPNTTNWEESAHLRGPTTLARWKAVPAFA